MFHTITCFLYLLATVSFPILVSTEQLPLTIFEWTLTLANDSFDEADNWTLKNVRVPGDVYLDLFEHGKIADPYFESNDVVYRWISYQNWNYTLTFDFPPGFLDSADNFLLRADGLDTIVDVSFNNRSIGRGENMFREYLFEIPKDAMSFGGKSQHLNFHFHSPVKYALQKSDEHKRLLNYSIGLFCRSELEHGECHANQIRKMQASFGWDWGPAFPTMGIWKFISIESMEGCYFKRFSVVPERNESAAVWSLHAEFFLYCAKMKAKVDVELEVRLDELGFRVTWNRTLDRSESDSIRIYKKLTLPPTVPIDLWWPNGLGSQRLYRAIGIFRSGEVDSGQKQMDIGFRRVQLIEDPVYQVAGIGKGLTFYFKINGVPTFLKGSNWIPGDSFQARFNRQPSAPDEDNLEFYFRSMREANMNCIRVWGGGVYESDRFYSLADQYGIMIWHDMMFAVNLYPATPEFLENVRHEMIDQVNRLKSHPSIIIWSGNNENELGLVGGWYPPMDTSTEKYKQDYLALYNATIYGVINETDFGTRPYVLSSPTNGRETQRQGGVARDPNDDFYGDEHVYGYGEGSWNWTKYPTPRCVTEYGFMSMPSMETLETGLNESSLESYTSDELIHRQHHDDVYDMLVEISANFDIIGCKPDDVRSEGCRFKGRKNLEHAIYLTQLHQAIAIKTETEHYRRWRSRLTDDGRGMTMCALYWQLNDIWQGPSWSSIDFGLKWKPLQYEAKRFFAPLIVSPYVTRDDTLEVVVVNDLDRDIGNTALVITGLSWRRFRPIVQMSIEIDRINRTSGSIVFESPVSKFRDQSVEIMNFVLVDSETGEELTPNNVMFVGRLRDTPHSNFGRVFIDRVQMEGSKVVRVDLTATGVAPFVWLDVRGIRGYFSDNAFTMITKRRTVRFEAVSNVSLRQFEEGLSVRTLGDIYM